MYVQEWIVYISFLIALMISRRGTIGWMNIIIVILNMAM